MLVFKHPKYYEEMRRRAKREQELERKLASRGGGWALGSQASIVNKKIKVDNLSLIVIMGYYKKG